MIRLLRIAKYQLRGLSFTGFIDMVKQFLFRCDRLLVYALQLEHIGKLEVDNCELLIEKGVLTELDLILNRSASMPWEFQCHRYDGVKDFFIARDSGGIRHISWIYYRGDPNRFLRLAPHDAEIKYCLTLPSFRGRGLYSKTLMFIARSLKESGFRRVFICVTRSNYASIRGIEKAGFKRVKEILLIKVFGLQLSKRFVPSTH